MVQGVLCIGRTASAIYERRNMDTRLRSIGKSATWRIISIVVLVAVAYFITGDVKKTTGITVIFQIILAVLYYLHERVWTRISWGKLNEGDK